MIYFFTIDLMKIFLPRSYHLGASKPRLNAKKNESKLEISNWEKVLYIKTDWSGSTTNQLWPPRGLSCLHQRALDELFSIQAYEHVVWLCHGFV